MPGPSSAAASVSRSAEIGAAPRLLATDVGTRQQQQVRDQPAHAACRAQRRLCRVGLLAIELVGQQFEVCQHAGERRAELVRGVGDELALARERRLALVAGGVQCAQHRLERARQLCNLVLGLGLGYAQRGIARTLDLAGGIGQLDNRAHRALRDEQSGQQGQDRACRPRRRRGRS